MAALSEYDFDYTFPPKPRARTYGKAGGRLGIHGATTSRTIRNGASTEASAAAPIVATSPSPPASPEPRARPRIVASSNNKGKLTNQRSGRAANPKLPYEVQSQPLPGRGDVDQKTKKRKLVRSQSEKKERASGAYSTPDSSPSGAQSPPIKKREEVPRSVPAPKAPPRSRSTPEKDEEMIDAVSQGMPFSAKTSRALDNLSLRSGTAEKPKHQIPLRLSQPYPPQPRSALTKSTLKKRPSPEPGPTSSKTKVNAGQVPKKRRLIDALVAQADSSSSEDEQEQEPSCQETTMSRNRQSPVFQSSSPPPPSSVLSKPRAVVRPVHTTKKTGPKFIYNQQRTMLTEEDTLFGSGGLAGIDEEPSNGPLFNFGRMTKSSAVNAFSFMDEDDETVNTGAVRSIHELRQAGANSRVADEMDDILDRIGSPSSGKPSSLRRGALLELAQKIKEKEFRRQFRNHSSDGGLFKSLTEEADVVSGYCIVAILTTLLASSVSTHLVQQVQENGLSSLLSRLLREKTDIALLAKDRTQNVSRNGQTTLTTIKSSILQLPIWEPISPSSLSPRTLALKSLDLILRQSTPSGDEIFTTEVTDRLFSILSSGGSNDVSWDFPAQQASSDFYLALYVLEGHSIHAMQSRHSSRWTSRYLPAVADILQIAVRRPAAAFNDLESLTLRITINMTNNNAEACRLFVEKEMLRGLAESACGAFEVFLNSMRGDTFLPKVHEAIIMMLGVMINFCVYYPPASQSLEESGDAAGSPLSRLIQVFADNHLKTSDADSMEKTQLNVALGYLSVLLGYLCLSYTIRRQFVAAQPKKNSQPLLDSINEFIELHHKVDAEFAALVRLKNLVDQLQT
ncbi:wings apart-like protein regulation of heterochromatin-domain-containing protein [Apodospora peruviana]|uniref:Wings apart-like protein regulation of heterochromatin-domain-containing protein n=1 Tax=Apodospora peruviana TaxID=516989 RepID=A0AAE0MAP9_9PEZI|nr:wings apart-like protein regulation of heterochromatin-domain-containing protein [Apodospora peruviana]